MESLMEYRVREVLLVASRYDAFVLEEDGDLSEAIVQEYRSLELSVHHAPRFARASGGRAALESLASRPVDLVITAARLPDMDLLEFGRAVRERPDAPTVAVLAAHAWEVPRLERLRESGAADRVLVWQGGIGSLLALIQQEEDARNAPHDVLEEGVQAIVVVEDDLRFLSFLLPHLYSEVIGQTGRCVQEGLSAAHRLARLQARPKILVAETLEDAFGLWERYGENVLAVLSDVSFPRAGRLDPEAGVGLARSIRSGDGDVPILLLSSDPANRKPAEAAGAEFAVKQSATLLEEIRRFLLDRVGFGDFVFRSPDGREVGRARTAREMAAALRAVPDASIDLHARQHQFSRWFKARTEFALAARLKPHRVADFPGLAEVREYIAGEVSAYLREVRRKLIADFDADTHDADVPFARIGSGSLGGKGRGLAFTHMLLAEGFPGAGLRAAIPPTVVLASDVFEGFLARNDLRWLPAEAAALDDEKILEAFRQGRVERGVRADLAALLRAVQGPLAVRSSSILEDSPYQPFAGVYATVMLPNNHPSLDVRLAQLLEAVKVVYASTYLKGARDYLETTPHRIEEEAMAVVLQRVVGAAHGSLYFPTVSGLAGSHNVYPPAGTSPADGVALVALGLGKSVVGGYQALRFCPARPQALPQMATPQDAFRNAQRRFWALDLARRDFVPGLDYEANLLERDVADAADAPGASLVMSTYLRENDQLVDGVRPGGSPLATFARLLRGRDLPLAPALTWILQQAREAMAVPVEAEFALDLSRPREGPPTLHVLQIRPMAVPPAAPGAVPGLDDPQGALVLSPATLGPARASALHDLVVVEPGLDRGETARVAAILEGWNRDLRREDAPYVLIGPGRWGSRDPWLGIPVAWSQISGARAIVESDFEDLEVDPSEGSHFFHNLTSSGAAFLAVHRRHEGARVDWGWLRAQEPVRSALDGRVRHLRLVSPVRVLVDGRTGRGAIVRDEGEEDG